MGPNPPAYIKTAVSIGVAEAEVFLQAEVFEPRNSVPQYHQPGNDCDENRTHLPHILS
jgi:hypothetical protein